MSIQLVTRSLFKIYQAGFEAPGVNLWNPSGMYKNWRDEYLYSNPTYIGTKLLISPQGKSVTVNYGPKYVVYPYGFFSVNNQPTIDQFIVSREDAIYLNLPRGDEIGSYQDPGVLYFDGFPLDRPLGENEKLGKTSPMAQTEILTPEDLKPKEITLITLDEKIDKILSLLSK